MDIYKDNDIEWEEIYTELLEKKISVSIPNKQDKEVRINSKNFIEQLKNINYRNRFLTLIYYNEIEKWLFSRNIVDMFTVNTFRNMRGDICRFMLDSEINNIDIRYINNEMLADYYKKTINKGKICNYNMLIRLFECVHNYMKNEVSIGMVQEILNDGIPKLNEYRPQLNNLDENQKKFYFKWEDNYLNNNYLDVKDNISYVFIYVYKVIEEFKENGLISKLKHEFNKIREGYGKYDLIVKYLNQWEVDAYIYLNKFDRAWKLINKYKNHLNMLDILIIKNNCKDKTLDSKQTLKLFWRKMFTGFFEDELLNNNFYIFFDRYLEQYEDKNIINYFLSTINETELKSSDFNIIETWFIDKERFNILKEHYEHVLPERYKVGYKNKYEIFSGVPQENAKYIEYKYIPQIVEEGINEKLNSLAREIEDEYRQYLGLSKVGEGWISETELYYKIKNHYNNMSIKNHFSPKWLGRQHFDIFFVNNNIAIEYQGDQHSKPIDFFGGYEAFKKQVIRDENKKYLSIKNNCHLIYVYPNYDINKVFEIIDGILDNKSNQLIYNI